MTDSRLLPRTKWRAEPSGLRMRDSWRALSARTQRAKVAQEFQKLRRIELANDAGIVVCVTCLPRMTLPWDEVDGGHCISRRHVNTLLLDCNVWPQCKHCNAWKGGERPQLIKWIEHKYGPELYPAMEALSKEPIYPQYKDAEWLHEFKQHCQAEIRWHQRRLEV